MLKGHFSLYSARGDDDVQWYAHTAAWERKWFMQQKCVDYDFCVSEKKIYLLHKAHLIAHIKCFEKREREQASERMRCGWGHVICLCYLYRGYLWTRIYVNKAKQSNNIHIFIHRCCNLCISLTLSHSFSALFRLLPYFP